MTDLELCPFCGCEMECRLMHDVNTYGSPMRYFIIGKHTNRCFLKDVTMMPYEDKDEAITIWNRRILEEQYQVIRATKEDWRRGGFYG